MTKLNTKPAHEDILSDEEIEELFQRMVWEDDLLGIEEPEDVRTDVHPFFVLD